MSTTITPTVTTAATAREPIPRPGTAWVVIGALVIGLAALGALVVPALWLAAVAGVFVAGAVMLIGGSILNQLAGMAYNQAEALRLAAHANTILAYIAERESQR